MINNDQYFLCPKEEKFKISPNNKTKRNRSTDCLTMCNFKKYALLLFCI